jgi:glucose-6-phosphate isomerase
LIYSRGFDLSSNHWESLNQIAPRLAAKDHTIWGELAENEAAQRLDWIDLPQTSRQLLPILDALSAWSRELGHKRFILCGMGGSSLAPEVIATHYSKQLEVLDSTDPDQIAKVLAGGIADSCIIVSSKSGTTIETKSQFAFFHREIEKLGKNPSDHFVFVTDPGSSLEAQGKSFGIKVILANPKVGGRFSALSAFGLVPAALLGIDVSVLLDDAEVAAKNFAQPNSEPIKVASALASTPFPEFYDADSIPGLGDWIEQLIGESTGKDGRGILPVIVNQKSGETITFSQADTKSVHGPLGAQFIFWEWTTALLCFLLNVDPFNQPNVAEAKDRTAAILKRDSKQNPPIFEDEKVQLFGGTPVTSLEDFFGRFLAIPSEYIAVMAYLNRKSSEIHLIREVFAKLTNRPVTFGWGPRFLHSTGQFHKGGPATGLFLQITTHYTSDLQVPGEAFSFSKLISAQAAGDQEALENRKLPFFRVHLKESDSGVKRLLSAAKSLKN